ncbi:Acyl-CoA dehydrogenase AFT10-1 [Penicillium taxi]|uniref:Acyl-CoA dehydrogenase AFT10-1 n=1 Tax=Penicillium taxi TaxID=168475 RepID=UPI002545043A|nr:Acyl-CoA dehydrogenase AFT10-1 [Penicillium taxi]KAJ5894685.1 Acyl-CoA dehydrogenase AFT10-1 [Penicillium taxi]
MPPTPGAHASPYSELFTPRGIGHHTEIHHNLRAYIRHYVETSLAPYAQEWEIKGGIPEEVRMRHCELGFNIMHPLHVAGLSLPGNVPFGKWDIWCSLIVIEELTRVGFVGVIWGLGAGNTIGCPPIAKHGTPEQQKRWLPGVAKGDIRFCLGITEPDAGSDVARIKTTARRDGDVYIVNGGKKWITNGVWADFCTAAVRTGGLGAEGISLLVIPLNATGVTRHRMYNSGVNASGSTLIIFDEVRVPVENLIGEENNGFKLIMSNFHAERIALSCASIRLARVCVEDAYNYAVQRETFGVPLIERQVIQAKIFEIGLSIEPAYAFLEHLVSVLQQINDKLSDDSTIRAVPISIVPAHLISSFQGMIGLLKVTSTRALEKSVREAQQILGGAGYSKSGKGARIEQISRDARVHVIGGGSEEIMMGMSIRSFDAIKKRKEKRLAKI